LSTKRGGHTIVQLQIYFVCIIVNELLRNP
jgi:hypothetical protein